MEQYKEKLKLQNKFYIIGCLILAGFALLAVGSELGWFSLLRPSAGDSHWQSTWYGYLTGVSCGIFAAMLACLIRNLRALKDEKKLKQLYVKLHDERTAQIYLHARSSAMQLLTWVGLIATVIAGYFSVPISITILVCTFVSSGTSLALIGYYSKKL